MSSGFELQFQVSGRLVRVQQPSEMTSFITTMFVSEPFVISISNYVSLHVLLIYPDATIQAVLEKVQRLLQGT